MKKGQNIRIYSQRQRNVSLTARAAVFAFHDVSQLSRTPKGALSAFLNGCYFSQFVITTKECNLHPLNENKRECQSNDSSKIDKEKSFGILETFSFIVV